MSEAWYNETLYENYGQRFKVDKILFENKTDHQRLVIFENQNYGRVMALDGIIRTTTADEFVYHEMMVHVPILAHGNVKKVLIVGGGDGGILREVTKHQNVQNITMVEIDGAVVEMSKKHLPSISDGAFEDKRLELIIDDGMNFIRNTKEKFDVIITDSTDPIGPGEVLFTDDFYSECKRSLNEKGIVISQNGVSFLQDWEFKATFKRLSMLYKDPWFCLACVPSYIGGFMSLAWASDNKEHRNHSLEVIQKRFEASPFKTKYYNPNMHIASLCLPQHVLDGISEVKTQIKNAA